MNGESREATITHVIVLPMCITHEEELSNEHNV